MPSQPVPDLTASATSSLTTECRCVGSEIDSLPAWTLPSSGSTLAKPSVVIFLLAASFLKTASGGLSYPILSYPFLLISQIFKGVRLTSQLARYHRRVVR
jgi:hypothetical protein